VSVGRQRPVACQWGAARLAAARLRRFEVFGVGVRCCSVPPIWALYVSLSVTADGRSRLGFDHYWQVMSEPQFWLSLWNSLAAAGLSTFVSIVLGVMAAYGMTRFKGNYERLALLVPATRMVPGIVLVIPFY
jgi:ABC-type glycerol-3-phosphate transport system permease component